MTMGGGMHTATTAAHEIGPIEAGWREFLRREGVLNSRPGDISTEENDWSLEAVINAATHKPIGEREWAALLIAVVYLAQLQNPALIKTALDEAEVLLGPEINSDAALNGT